MNYVVCVKHGTKYSHDYVNRLYLMVRRNLTIDYSFICLTDDKTGLMPEIEVIDILEKSKVKGWWHKIKVFDPHFLPSGSLLFFDLDVIIYNNIDKLFSYKPGEFCIIRDFNRAFKPEWKKYNSSVFRLESGSYPKIYNKFIDNPRIVMSNYRGDQDWIYVQAKDAVFWPDSWIRSYKWEMRKSSKLKNMGKFSTFTDKQDPIILEDSCVAVFHGDPKPHQCNDDWCKENWK